MNSLNNLVLGFRSPSLVLNRELILSTFKIICRNLSANGFRCTNSILSNYSSLVSNSYVFPQWMLSRHLHYIHPVRKLQFPVKYPEIEFPEKRKLRFMEKVPQPVPGQRQMKMKKQLIDMRGPELTHTFLLHRQYGIRALQGGQLHHGHFEMIRTGINRNMDESRMFAIWRIDAPWKPITKKGQGHRMGGGKGSIDHYTTPVREGRVIIEFGGYCEFHEAYDLLIRVARKLPFHAGVVSQEILDEEKKLEEEEPHRNLNPFSFKYCVKNNIGGSRKWLSPYDYIWHGKYR